ncbi:restriction endonuclease [Nocardia macrotermitis]|uniref:Restriction endonuclease type IV Mrr domain-containing protein n=1 Tax=Nocardia macrotermitis TaxID=2585198 RepID=A0A7K0D7G4_9NOCA|nr:restriction endonuclease [Nocardia macrotermitis]MQY21703.1 hypothetical protein [Nocardia macrotermitis]
MSIADSYQGLRATYRAMQRLDGLTPQRRGQQFNEWLADLLRACGLEAKASQRSAGEIDVVFSIGDVRYIVEAKWTKTKADTGQLAKLQKRVRQRLSGTYGVFVSMAGYTDEALKDLIHGDRLELLLLDQEHIEALLSEEISPQQLLSDLRDAAAFTGQPYTKMTDLRSAGGSGASLSADRMSPRVHPISNAERDSAGTWDPHQSSRGNPTGQYVAFSGYQAIYWALVGILVLLAAITTVLAIGDQGFGRIFAVVAVVFEVVLIMGFWRLAMHPIRLEVGRMGIQAFFPQDTAWMPWDRIDRVDVVRVNGNLAVVAWSEYAKLYPTTGEAGQGPHYVPTFDAVAICPLGPLRARRHEIVRALQSYGQNRC